MNRVLVVGLFVIGLFVVMPVKADWVVNSDGTVTRSQILGDDSEKKEERKEEKKEEKVEKIEKKEEKREENKTKIEIQKGPVQLKIDRENGVLKIKSKNEKGEEFEMETKKDEKIKIKNKDKEREEIEIASGSGQSVKFKKNGIEAETKFPISVDLKTNELIVNEKNVTVLPDQAVKNAFSSGSATAKTKIELKNRGQKMVYEINREEKKKLFGFFDLTFNKSSVVSSDTGMVLERTQTWWSSLLENFSR